MFRLLVKLAIAGLIANASWRMGSAYLSFYRFKDAVAETTQYSKEKSDDELRQDRRVDHAAQQLRRTEPEIAPRVDVHDLDAPNRVHRRQSQGKQRPEKDDENRRNVSDAEPQDRDWNPGQGRNGPQNLQDRRDRHASPAVPAEHHAERNSHDHRGDVPPGDPEERRDDMLEEEALLGELGDRANDRERPRKELGAASAEA